MCVCVCVEGVRGKGREHERVRKRRDGRKRGTEGDRKVPPKLTILLILDEGTALSRALDVNCSKQGVYYNQIKIKSPGQGPNETV